MNPESDVPQETQGPQEPHVPGGNSARGFSQKRKARGAKIDLSAGLVRKPGAPAIDLSAGLVAKVGIDPPHDGASSAAKPPAASSFPNSAPAERIEPRKRPRPTAASPLPEVAARYSAARAEAVEQQPAPGKVPVPQSAPAATDSPAAQPAESSPRPRLTRLPAAAQEPRPEAAQPLRGREPQPRPASALATAQQTAYPADLPAQSWERIPERASQEPGIDESSAASAPPEEVALDSKTRMAGLRNLIFSLGLKNTRQNQDESDRSEEVPTPVESPRQRAAAAHSYIPVERAPVQHVPDRADSGNGSPTLVTAPPEFLPPKPMVEHTGEGHSKGPSSTAQRDRRDTYDDVEILPSWRGQYRRR